MNIDQQHCQIHRLPGGMQSIHCNYGLWIIGGGACVAPAGSYAQCPWRYFEYYSISHLREGGGRLKLAAEEERVLVPGDAVIVCPGTRNRYGGDWNKSYCEDAIRFYGPVADMLRQSGILRDEVVHFGKLRRLQPIIELAGDPAIDAQINANLELQKLLVEMYNARRKSTSETEIELLLARIKARPEYWWTVEEMAELCNTSIDQLRRIFLKHTGVLPKVYVDRFKMTKAAELLLAGDLKVAEVARRFGYVDPYHFSRRFKCIMGFSPRRYRREISVLP
ncbi:AraC family transcriptional regulator [Victivallis sp. Marseille-Q1083]|uniref:helix-turn-helix domain-containing protein n=1 Tax=Victivallis sp. Marseille-Q1083 TaxID=2717288 RepID=UPI00158E712B|nr:AraC family transcriptional regulator [Victivallis sp. Marseille-Q1083]